MERVSLHYITVTVIVGIFLGHFHPAKALLSSPVKMLRTVRADMPSMRVGLPSMPANITSMPGSAMETVGDAMGVVVEMEYLKFKYFNRNFRDTEFLINITDENFADRLRKIWNYNNPNLKIITHGWISSDASMAVADIKNVYLEQRDFNVITLDWSYTASTKAYPIPAVMTYQVGTLAAEVINKLVELNFTHYDNVHMIGHSLGAHVSGATGANCKQKIARITGLDPAGPGFQVILGKDRKLDESDAQFVDVIHTAAGSAGYYGVLGHVDFYPNSGQPPQPGCNMELPFLSSNQEKSIFSNFGCSHMRSYELFSESIRHPTAFKSIKCQSWSEYMSGTYPNDSDIQYMGDPVKSTARGVYYLATGKTSPYGVVETMEKAVNTKSNEAGS
uniref:Lipase member H-B n=1 Tax=Cacopsylla melanoneura TaxID=428564 RepID=A0A8D8Z5M2_9HEMI